jgi:hypothetical protein
MKRILTAAVALAALAASTQAQATDFILSNNFTNPNYLNFRITYSDATTTSAFLEHVVGNSTFTDNFFFAPVYLASVGGGSATTNTSASLDFSVPNGLTITGYALTPEIQAALQSAFVSPDYSAQLATINAYLAGSPPVVYSQAGTGNTEQQLLSNVPLSAANFYKITVSGTGTAGGSLYNGNLSATAVPEPATWAMMLVGFGAVGFGMRRRRKEQPKVRFAF